MLQRDADIRAAAGHAVDAGSATAVDVAHWAEADRGAGALFPAVDSLPPLPLLYLLLILQWKSGAGAQVEGVPEGHPRGQKNGA